MKVNGLQNLFEKKNCFKSGEAGTHLTKILLVQPAILQCFRLMFVSDRIPLLQIRNRTGKLQNTVETTARGDNG
jgi:hypothetical protein